MKHATTLGILMSGALVAGTAFYAVTPACAQRARSGSDNRDNSRSVSRPEQKSESRPAPRIETPSFRTQSPRETPRFSPAPSMPTINRNTTRDLPRMEPLQRPAPSTPSNSWRDSSVNRYDNGGVRSNIPTPRPDSVRRESPRVSNDDSSSTKRDTPTGRVQNNGGVRSGTPSDNPNSGYRGTRVQPLPNENRPNGGAMDRSGRGTTVPNNGSLSGRTGKSPQDIARTGNQGRRIGGPDKASGSAPAGWRPPSVDGTRKTGDNGPVARGSGNAAGQRGPSPRIGPSNQPRTTGMVRNVPTHRGYHPPKIDHNRWGDGGRRYGGRHFYTIDLGWYDPWYTYNWGIFSGWRFYYPYYYCGPYISGIYYSPFWCYGSWAPIYIHPERVIYVERRVYLHDVVDDDYDLYSSYNQTSMRDAMEDIRSAWLDGEGGRLLDHVNQAIPIRIYQKGAYKYSLDPEDFRDITKDALNRIETVDFDWTNVDKISADEVRVEARHTFYDPDGEKMVIRLTYTLEKARGGWWITESGSEKWLRDI